MTTIANELRMAAAALGDTLEPNDVGRLVTTCDQLADLVLAYKAQLELAEDETRRARSQLRAEQTAAQSVVDRICKAMGTWTGPWDNAACERLKAMRTQGSGPVQPARGAEPTQTHADAEIRADERKQLLRLWQKFPLCTLDELALLREQEG